MKTVNSWQVTLLIISRFKSTEIMKTLEVLVNDNFMKWKDDGKYQWANRTTKLGVDWRRLGEDLVSDFEAGR